MQTGAEGERVINTKPEDWVPSTRPSILQTILWKRFLPRTKEAAVTGSPSQGSAGAAGAHLGLEAYRPGAHLGLQAQAFTKAVQQTAAIRQAERGRVSSRIAPAHTGYSQRPQQTVDNGWSSVSQSNTSLSFTSGNASTSFWKEVKAPTSTADLLRPTVKLGKSVNPIEMMIIAMTNVLLILLLSYTFLVTHSSLCTIALGLKSTCR